MKTFKCGACGNTVYFENIQLPALRASRSAFAPTSSKSARSSRPARRPLPRVQEGVGRPPALLRQRGAGGLQLAGARRLPARRSATPARSTAPSPTSPYPANVLAWGEFERAKKRLVYSLLALGACRSTVPRSARRRSTFDFVNDALTGHLDGVITIAVGEADAVERERQRKAMAETYRSHARASAPRERSLLLDAAHRRHRPLVPLPRSCSATSARTTARRSNAITRRGRRADWSLRHVSAYASSHPWEDWAETWAHYLHMVDALETAAVHRRSSRAPAASAASGRGRCARSTSIAPRASRP